MKFRLHHYIQGAVRANYPVQRGRVAVGRALDWIRRNNFLILSSPRSGTTLLLDYLNCSRQVRCYGEILGRGHIQYGNPYRLAPERIRLHVESYFVKRPGTWVGAKILTFHLDELPITIDDLLEVLNSPRIILLYRENLLQQYTSFHLAMATGVWHPRKPVELAPIRLDPDDFLAFAARERRMWQENCARLNLADTCVVSYEDLHADPRSQMARVFDYLNVEPAEVRSRFVKANPRPLAQKVANYQEFAARGIPDQALYSPLAAFGASRRAA